MNSVLRQLHRWRVRERAVRLAWGGARLAAISAALLALACFTDWAIDRYSGSQTWRGVLSSTWVLAGVDPLSAGETPFWVRFLMTSSQLALAAGLAVYLLVKPWKRTPSIDVLAGTAEKAHPEFDHRLVTALQLNRPTAKTAGMSPVLITEVTREAGEIAERHDLLKLIDYRRLRWAALAIAPVALLWLIFLTVNSSLAGILLERQALLGGEIPRRTHLNNITREVWPTGAEVTVRYEVTGVYAPGDVGVLRIVPDDQPEEFYELRFEQVDEAGGVATFVTKLPPSSRDFSFQARLGGGRTKVPGRVFFEAPPQLAPEDEKHPPLIATQVLPTFLGVAPDGSPYTRKSDSANRGEVVDALPQSKVLLEAHFNKPVAEANLIVIERAEGVRERDLIKVAPFEIDPDRKTAFFGFATTSRTIGYRLELVDDRGFINPVPIRRGIRMWEDRPPAVEFKAESMRSPDTDENRADYIWDMPLHPEGRIQVVYGAKSELGIREANIRYRVVPRGVQLDLYPEWYKKINHPRDDRDGKVFKPYRLSPGPDPVKNNLGDFVPDLGLFRYSYRGLAPLDRDKMNVGFYAFPSRAPATEPGELEAGGRMNFEVAGLQKLVPDTSAPTGVTSAKLEIGDTVELYLEVFDKLVWHKLTDASFAELRKAKVPDGVVERLKPLKDQRRMRAELAKEIEAILGPADTKQHRAQIVKAAEYDLGDRMPGYTREAKRKTVLSEGEVAAAMFQRDEERQKRADKLRQLAEDQIAVFKEQQKK